MNNFMAEIIICLLIGAVAIPIFIKAIKILKEIYKVKIENFRFKKRFKGRKK